MKKIFLLFFVLTIFLFVTSSKASTNVSGFINANTNWTVAGAPYIVVGNALLSQGYTLTIDPGVVVKFNSQKALQIDGELIAIGTAANRITFTSNQVSPAPGDWAKLHFSSYSVPATYDSLGHYVSGTIMKYCDVLYAGDLDYGEVHVESAMPYISQSNIRFSSHNGIYCSGSTFILDSSLVSNNAQYGLFFNQFTQNSCGLMINGDTMISNSMGGILLGQSNGSCPTEIKNCNFISNGYHGAIYDSLTYSKINIHDNYFLTNGSIWGIITFYNTLSSGRIENNYFDTNSCYDYIISSGGGNSVVIKKNYFINNTSLDGGIIGFESLTNDTISCNTLLNNHTYKAAINLSTYVYSSNGVIQHNIIDGNICNTNNETGIFNAIQAPTGVLDFSNNMVRNNSTGTGRLCHIVAYLNDSTEQLKIYHNEFKNNTSNIILFFAGPLINNSGLDFMYFKHNNFLDASNEYTLYDSIPYGSPNILADSNYWGSTSTQHVDSVIYDYFDFAAQSVVYYLPISEVANSIDTVCRVPCFVSAAVLNNASCNGANNGAAIVTSSGTPPFNYAWSPSGGSGATATNLAAGTYTCYITDSVSCTTWTTVHITQPPGLNVYLDQPNNVLCYGGNSGCADVYVYNGTPPYTYNWSPSGGTGATACNLTANTYTVSITEANGCLTTDTITITQPPQLTANTSTLNNVSCFNGNNGRASVTAGGGTPAYAYHWSPSGGNSITANNLIATTYTVTVTDAHACSITSTATVTQPPVITETITVTNASCSACSDGSAYVNVGGGMAPYTYLWTPSGGNGATASNLLPGSYTCCITDANGCTKCQSDSVSYPLAVNEISHTQTGLTIIPNPAHNSFTISLNNQSSLNNSQLTIFDVTGRVVHEQKIQSQLSTVNCQLSAGVYFVKVSDGERVYEQKLVVE